MNMAESSGGIGESFGQKRPPLYEMIKNILREYPSGQIFKEIIQNADDARATEVKFFLDSCQLESLPCDTSHEHKLKFTSPALLSYNDAPFKKEDWESIQSLQQSGKATNPHKVGKFGIGFNSVYHITDLPVILSQDYCGFLEPQEEVWRGESGKGFYLESLSRTYPDVLIPFDKLCGFARGHAAFNNKTFLRFPLRTKPSKLSSDSYTIDKLRALLQPLKEEAKYLLLFLRSVTSIEVLEINNDRDVLAPKCIFKVNIDSQEQIMLQKQQLVRNVESRFTTPYINACHVIKDTANFSVTIFDGRKRSSHNWLVVNQIGSNEKSVMKSAEEQHVLPWVGTAFEINSREMDPNGRIFCVLPLPVEDRAPLSVHINGTFAVTSNRRSLKWESQERKDDKESKWNTILVEKCLPTCLVELVNQLIQLCRSDPAIVYSCWPDVSSVSSTPWRGVLEPFYQSLLKSNEVVHSVRGGNNWISVREGIYISSSEYIPQPVINAMISCNVNIVTLSNKCQVALILYYGAVDILSPRIARSHLKSNPRSYNSLSFADKLDILDYCLSDDIFNDLNGLELLPMANNSFQQFSQPYYANIFNYAYICSKHIPSTLLPELQHILVSMFSTNKQLHDKLVKVASSGHTHVKVLSVSLVADLLSHCNTSLWSQEQLRQFWQWLSQNELQYFSHKQIVPVTLSFGHTDIKPLSKQDGVVYIPHNFYQSELLVSGLHKCGIKFADACRFPYLVHRQISKYLYQFRADDIIDALESFNLSQVKFNNKEAQAIQNLICSCSNLTQSRVNTICSLAIFSIIQESTRYSINSIKTPPYARYKPICVKLSGLNKHQLPNSPLLIDGDANNGSLLSLLYNSVISHMSTIDYLLTVAFPQIRNNQFGYENVVNFMKNVLDLFSTFQYSSNFSQLTSAISSLPFIDVGGRTTYDFRAPEDLFDPNNVMLKKLFQDESKFPSSDFKFHLSILRQHCKLKSINSVTASDIYEIIGSIKQRSSIAATNETDYAKAIAVLDFLTKYPSTFNQSISYNYRQMPLLIALINESQCWLPVVKDRPRNYPSCLSWNGSSFYCQSLVSSDYNPLYALPSSINESDSLPMISGSQIIFIQNVPRQIAQRICSSSSNLTQAVVSHFKHIIDNEVEISSETLEELSMKTYSYLQSNITDISRNIFNETDKWIWLEKSSAFVDTRQVTITACSSFRTSLEPLLFVLPSRWHKFSPLFTKLGVTNEMTVKQIVSILHTIRNSPKMIASNEAWSIVRAILSWLTEEPSRLHEINDDVLVPIESDSEYPDLRPIDTVAYTDNEVLADIASSSDEDYSLIHSNVAHLGAALGAIPLSDHLDITEDVFEDAGQHEPLTTRLANILKEYKDGLTIIKEMIQNADDAEATEINILYDSRNHTTQNLLFKGMGESHGPALIVHNNSTFSDEDFINITKLAGATKSNKPLKIGKFGVGFCSVYHITDVPSFISGEWLYIFDPTLQYLKGIIRNENQPGKKVKYMSKFISKSKQLAPYENIFNFKSSEVYNGTMFRFPFRTHSSQISSTIYNEYLISELKEDLKENGSKLLLFLQNIKRITFSTISVRGTVMEELSIQCITDGDIKQCITRVPSSEPMTEYWLVSSHNVNFRTANGIQPGTGSVACELSSVDGAFECKKVDGRLFCFLPLSIPSTGLPVHVNGNFAVMSNRSGIWTSTTSGIPSDSREKWNLILLKEVIPKAYCDLLLKLKSLSSSGKVRSYTFHSLWPLDVELQMKYPWGILTSELYTIISQKELFYSVSTDKWLKLSECKFLSPKLFIGTNIINDDGTCINEAVIHLQLPVVSLPSSYQEQINIYPDMVMDQEMFIRSFLSNIIIFNANIKIRNQVLLHMLSWLVTTNEDSTLMELIKVFPCIPCSPEGVELKSVHELLDPNIFSDMFDSSDGMFPVSSFMMNKYIHQAMINLGLLRSNLPSKIIVKCAESVNVVFSEDRKRGMKRIKLLIGCIENNQSDDLCSLLKDVPFLPVLSKPEDFILPWKGDGHNLLPPSQVIAVTSYDNLWKCGVTVGSQKAIVDISREGGCGLIDYKVLSLLNIPTKPSIDDVLNHFQYLINLPDISMCESPDKIKQIIETICRNVYEFLDRSLPKNPNSFGISLGHYHYGRYNSSKFQVPDVASSNSKERISEFSDKPFIWTGQVFVAPSDVSKEWKCNGPCLYRLPDIISGRKALLEALNIKDKFDAQKLLSTFRHLHESYTSQVIPKEYHILCDSITTELNSLVSNNEEVDEMIKNECIYLVDDKHVVRLSSDLLYNDTQWLAPPDTADDHYVHPYLFRDVAIKLGVKATLSKFLDKYTSTSHFKGVPFGQNEKLTDRIKNILRDYPFDITFIKELIQNADDAKATKMCIILDKRQHGTERILSKEWKELQGPAILVWDDKNFTDEDIKGIQRLGVGSKRDDDESIGQFGIGFNVVYHVTDCPSFITRGDTLCVFDPHCHYVPGADPQCPGRQYNVDESFWESMPDLRTAYLQDDLPNKPPGLDSGVLFRFPLRCTKKHILASQLLDKKVEMLPLTADKMERYLRDWTISIKDALLFLNNLTQFEVYIIDNDSKDSCRCDQIASYSVVLTDNDSQTRMNFKETCSNFKKTRECKQIMYPLTIKTKHSEEQWLIQQGVGDVGNPSGSWEFINQTIPKHGIAAPLMKCSHFMGKVFCFLPLPVYTNLPVHINGQFVLSSNRRSLWNSTEESDPKAIWNNSLIEAIAYSYAEFLCKARGYYITKDNYDKADDFYSNINLYYSLFPFWDPPFKVKDEEKKEVETKTTTGLFPSRGYSSNTSMKAAYSSVQHVPQVKMQDWNGIGQMIFKKLWDMNAPVLVCEVYQSKVIIPQWHVLHNDDDIPHEQAYFFPESKLDKDVKFVLRNIGMKLTCAPYILYQRLKEFDPAIISPQSVYQYYTQYHKLVIREYPCSIEDTPFKNAQKFCGFVSYMLVIKINPNDIKYTLPSDPNDAPLLLTADSLLRGFSNSKNILMSKYYHLFESSSSKFLHPEMLHLCSKISSDYFASTDNTPLDVIDIMRSNYSSLGQHMVDNSNQKMIHNEVLKSLWECLNDDPIFKHHKDNIIKTWALIPSCDSRLFNSSSCILPIIEPLSTDLSSNQKTFKLLISFSLPKYNSTVSYHAEKYCLKMDTHHSRILSALYHFHRQNNIDSFLNSYPQAVDLFLDYFGNIDFRHDRQSLQYIKQLPLFVTAVTNERTSIAGKEFYVWPIGFCEAGYDKWAPIDRIVFLKSDGKWRSLCYNIEALGGENIDERSIYLKMIFPMFSALTDDERKNHLQYIRDNIHSDVMNQINYGNKRRKQDASIFLSTLKNLKCIKLKNGDLSTVCSFCDHRKAIFNVFSDRYEFVPKEYQDDYAWIRFFCDLGLRQTVTFEEFKQLCLIVYKGEHKNISHASKVLVNYLFSESAKEWHTNQEILSEIGDICFVQVDPLTILKWIKEPCQPPQYFQNENIGLTKLNESVIYDSAATIWTVKPVVSLPRLHYPSLNYFQNDKLTNDVVHGLGVTVRPSIEDVYQNLINISNSGLASFDLFNKYRPHFELKEDSSRVTIETVVAQTFDYLFENKATVLLQKLSTTPCVPVPVDSTAYDGTCIILKPVLVKPLQVVRHVPDDCTVLFPYVHQLPSFMNNIKGDLKSIGISDNIEIKTLQHMLQFIHERQKDKTLGPNHAKRVRTAILIIHKLCLEQNHSKVVKDIVPLYYPNERLVLRESTELVFIDSHHRYKTLRKPNFFGSLFMVPHDTPYLMSSDDCKSEKKIPSRFPKEIDICLSLPKEVRPKGLSLVCTEELVQIVEGSNDCPMYLHFNNLKKMAPLLEKLLCQILTTILNNDPAYCSELSSSFVQLMNSIIIKTVQCLNCKVKLNSQLLGTIDVPYFMQPCEAQDILFVDSKTNASFVVFKTFAHSLCIAIAQRNQVSLTKYLQNKTIEVMCEFLEITCPGDLEKILYKHNVESEEINDIYLTDDDDDNDYAPELGKKIPDYYKALLYDGDIDHVFQPEEWVGYERAEGCIVYAIVLYPVIDDSGVCNSSAIMKKYRIRISENEDGEIDVSALDLYKFIVESPIKEADSQEIVLSESSGGGLDELRNLKDSLGLIEIKKKICHELVMIWKLINEDERKKAIKRLYIKYHPDKANPNEHDLYEEAFKFLTSQIERLEEGLPLQDPQSHTESSDIDSTTSSKWHQFFRQCYTYVPKPRTNFSHSSTRSSGSTYNTGNAGIHMPQWMPPQPTPDVPEAKRWLRQAESDMEAMMGLLSLKKIHCCQVLFLAHEICEKSLKGGMYAFYGLNSSSLKTHELRSHKSALSSRGGELAQLSQLVCCEVYYLRTRFPNQVGGSSAPVDVYTDEDEAKDVALRAEKVYKLIRDSVYNINN